MSKARFVITAVLVEGRKPAEVAPAYGVHRSWIYKLLARHHAEGEAAFDPQSRRAHTAPSALAPAAVELIRRLRKELAEQHLDTGADTIGWHLHHHHGATVSRAGINRCLRDAGLITPEPKKRPKSSDIRFQTELPNECWQSDFTHYPRTRPDGSPGAERCQPGG